MFMYLITYIVRFDITKILLRINSFFSLLIILVCYSRVRFKSTIQLGEKQLMPRKILGTKTPPLHKGIANSSYKGAATNQRHGAFLKSRRCRPSGAKTSTYRRIGIALEVVRRRFCTLWFNSSSINQLKIWFLPHSKFRNEANNILNIYTTYLHPNFI